MVAVKYSLLASLLASSVVAAPAVQERSLDVQERGAEAQELAVEDRDLEERTLLPIIMLLKLIHNISVQISGAISIIGSITINGHINSPQSTLVILSKAINILASAVPTLIANISGNINLHGGNVNQWAPGITTIVNLTVQVINQLVITVGKVLPKNPSDQQLIQIIALLKTSRRLVIQLNASLTVIVVGDIDFGKKKLCKEVVPQINNAINAVNKCKDQKECKGW
ncbi:hypothetical protein CJU90_4394 [Yarrowia sp. C11]|nr:hypothetical protein CKK34_6676 [Yarrowia sp. E02]KAG5365325.1 hypothetical protein CJU90_4394 [Yarrowia sp. C11]